MTPKIFFFLSFSLVQCTSYPLWCKFLIVLKGSGSQSYKFPSNTMYYWQELSEFQIAQLKIL